MKEQIRQTIIEVCKKLYDLEVVAELTRPDSEHGDFATNVAMQLAKPLARNPRDIAQEIVEQLQSNTNFAQVGVAGPGFINITLTDRMLISSLNAEEARSLSGMKILVEYSDANPLKPLHAGHLYTTLVGDVIARLIEAAGAETIRLNYGGDVGLHIGKTMWSVMKFIDGKGLEYIQSIPVNDIPTWIGVRYAEGHIAYEEDVEAKQEIIIMNKKIYQIHATDDHSSQPAQIYWHLRKLSYDSFKALYERLQVVEFDRFIPESEVTPLGLQTVQEQLSKGVFKESNGAVVFEGDEYGLHTRVFINSEGLPTYETKDVGNSLTKWKDYHYDQSIIITDTEQKQYMQVVIKAIEQFAFEPAQRTKHLTHGKIKMRGGIKMSSRLGNALMANDILDSAVSAGEKSGQATNMEVVLAAVKYAFVKNRIGGDIIYDVDESIATEGNSGPYLQYAHARAKSILSKSEHSTQPIIENTVFDTSERILFRKITAYPEVIELATRELAPHHICTYLYELAQTFNRFYEQSKVLGDPREKVRLTLIAHYAETLKKGLHLLGIHAPEQM